MDLTSDHPYWFVKNGLLQTFPHLKTEVSCDVAVVGGGITGAMVAYRLSQLGFQVALLDRRDVGLGSTSASTALLQYEIDVPLIDMAKKIGRENAERAYRLSHQSIDDIESLVQEVGSDCGFRRKVSIYLAHDRPAAKHLAVEARARRETGLDVEYLRDSELQEQFGLQGAAALITHQAASCDAYRLAHDLLAAAVQNGAQVFDRTDVTEFDIQPDHVVLKTSREVDVHAKRVVIAAGYEAQNLLKERVVDLDNTYAFVSEPLADVSPWNLDWMLWEAREPYLYLRCTDDGRILAGGEDDKFHSPTRRDAVLGKRVKAIRQKVRELIPDLEWEVEFAWAGTFGTTQDGLAYIGESPEYQNCLFALGFGGNGITFSSIATQLIADQLRNIPNQHTDLFRFGR
ncbi:MAG: FAD-binding oxidoreductase [Planctomycetales bacterium]|nr:FAD-binding oxidoreductase [Planctomycetales bacterium]MCA9168630.1 FAD-binding oxidoreductase [Planctomycetales bacterium]